jgi:uncharacterized protein YbcI
LSQAGRVPIIWPRGNTLNAQERKKLCEEISEFTGMKVTALFTDIDALIGESVIVFTLDQDLESNFQ